MERGAPYGVLGPYDRRQEEDELQAADDCRSDVAKARAEHAECDGAAEEKDEQDRKTGDREQHGPVRRPWHHDIEQDDDHQMMRKNEHVARDHLEDVHDQRRRHCLDQMAGGHEDIGAFLERRRDQGPDDQAGSEGRQEGRDVLLEQRRIDRADARNRCGQRQRDPERADHGPPVAQRNVHQGERAPTIEPCRLGQDLLRCELNSTAPLASCLPMLRQDSRSRPVGRSSLSARPSRGNRPYG